MSHVFWDSLYVNILEWSIWSHLYLINFEIPIYAQPYIYRTYLFGNRQKKVLFKKLNGHDTHM